MIGLLALAALAASGCPVESAHYVLRGMPEITAHYRAVDSGKDWPSQLAMAVHSSKTGETSWWVPWNGGTDGRTNIASTTDATRPDWRPPAPDNGPRPHGNRLFLTTDASYNIMQSAPSAVTLRQCTCSPPRLADRKTGFSSRGSFSTSSAVRRVAADRTFCIESAGPLSTHQSRSTGPVRRTIATIATT